MNTIEDRSFIANDVYARNVEEKKALDHKNHGPSKDEVSGDRVELSNGARQILETQKKMQALPDVREKLIDDIKNQIASGTYQVESKGTAFRMLRESLLNDLLG